MVRPEDSYTYTVAIKSVPEGAEGDGEGEGEGWAAAIAEDQ